VSIPVKIKIAIAVAIVAVLCCVAYWWWQTPKPLSESDFMVVGDIANESREPNFDGSLREAVKVSLAQSPRLNLVSDEKIRTTLRNLGTADGSPLTREVARSLCERTGAKAYLTGSVKQSGNAYEIELVAYSFPGDDRIARERDSAARTDLVIQHLGTMITKLRAELGESVDSVKQFEIPLERATTPIPAALKAYEEARSAIRDKGDIAAVPHYKRAIELDARFALAHSGLAVSYYNLNQMAQAGDEIRQAYEAADRQTLRQKLNITTLYYDLGVGDVEKAIEGYKMYIRAYPRDDVALGNLSSEYFVLGNYEEAARCSREALKIDPDSSAWYENLSTALLAMAKIDEADAVLREAFSRKLDDAALHSNRYSLAFLKNDTVGMEQEAAWAANKPGGDDSILAAQADTEAFYGRLAKARELTRKAVDSAKGAELPESAATWVVEGAMREVMFGNMDEAKQSAREALRLAPESKDVRAMAALIFARTGDDAEALKITDDLRATYVSNMVMQKAWLPVVRAQMALHKKQNAEAIEQLEVVAPYEKGQLTGNLSDSCMIPVYLRAEAELNIQKAGAALAEFQKIETSPGIIGSCWSGPLARLGEARARAANGSTAEARGAYEKFFVLWKDADPNIPVLKQAKLEAAKLH
jgi:tetratricopeptide (TPR) repeat protein